ncbi:MAG: hypothetical protein LBR28_03565 [Bacteroidales bacterium]|jgi:putative iron-only hydrogenase system regulator|nr:hypothetical protein [Bacteroidales bacterium]
MEKNKNFSVKKITEKSLRTGTISIVIYDISMASDINKIISEYSNFILARQGLPLRSKGLYIINLVIEATLDIINALTGKLGRLNNVEVKAIVVKEQQNA